MERRVALAVVVSVAWVLSCLSACAPRDGRGASGANGEERETTEVIVEQMPDGSVRRTTIRRKSVPAPPPPARPADPFPADPMVRYNVERVNAYRARGGLPPLLYDARISAFATAGSQRLARDHVPHAHFAENAQAARFGSRSAENQGDPGGVPAMSRDPGANARQQIDVMLKLMMDEGPGGGHYDNMMNPRFRRIGIGNVYVGGRLYMTNDFSD